MELFNFSAFYDFNMLCQLGKIRLFHEYHQFFRSALRKILVYNLNKACYRYSLYILTNITLLLRQVRFVRRRKQ